MISVRKFHINERMFGTKRSHVRKVNWKPPCIVASVHREKIRIISDVALGCKDQLPTLFALVNCRSIITHNNNVLVPKGEKVRLAIRLFSKSTEHGQKYLHFGF